ncbi:SPOR domain-containing protein [Lutibacter sp.]|uniref:SPOR domain-containing protein n=1 Tax=Lutibacter sp. TaxID=1925666 RepID=UPI0025B95955|nr:SPOR domain-containing protein [Lutibacter sp.]MCF6181948.1 SPOR domain-containing protein [Lutibacter sp.]
MSLNLRKILIVLIIAISSSYSTIYSQTEKEKINTLITQKRSFNKNNKVSTVYKIQLFNGVEKKAYAKKNQFQSIFPMYKVKIIYITPEWKTQVGNFATRLEADRILNIIQQKFIGAFVLKDKI